jgi:hypothetical protein
MERASMAVAHLDSVVETDAPVPAGLAASLGEVAVDSERFGRHYRLARDLGIGIPCLVIGDTRPRPFEIGVLSEYGASELSFELIQQAHDAVMRSPKLALDRRARAWVTEIEPRETKRYFLDRVHDFLAARFVFRRDSPAAGPEYRPFRVVTYADGYRVHCSPVYLVKTRFFGAVTTPVDGSITPGIWMFGVDRPAEPIRWDSGEFSVPPLSEAVLTVA